MKKLLMVAGLFAMGVAACGGGPSNQDFCRATVNATYNCTPIGMVPGAPSRDSAIMTCNNGGGDGGTTMHCTNADAIRNYVWNCLQPVSGASATMDQCNTYTQCVQQAPACQM